MKNYLKIILVALLLTEILFSCKKSSDPTPLAKDYGASIRGKTWWGTFKIPGQTAQYFAVHFKADSSLAWSQWSGEYTGKWTLHGNKLTIIYISNVITADISDDGKLTNFGDNNGVYAVINADLLANPNTPIDNTIWKGTESVSGVLNTLQLSFIPGLKVEAKKASTTYGVKVYTRSPSGAAIRFTVLNDFSFFGVFTSETVIKGCENSTENLWQVSKQ
jgi:hypothetical protein